jgi:CRP-like cAMP-binding protein
MAGDALTQKQVGNRLLAALAPDDFRRVLPQMTQVELAHKSILCLPGEAPSHAYFPTSAVLAWLNVLDDAPEVEAASVGREGMAGWTVLLGSDVCPGKMLVQVPGQAWQIPMQAFKALLKRDSSLERLCRRYLLALVTQLARSLACNTLHSLEKRCCRWLLMTHDRIDGDRFPMTHEFLASMLGVRRASVTETAMDLQERGFIQYVHGKVTVQNRTGLEEAACPCYRAIRKALDAVFQ